MWLQYQLDQDIVMSPSEFHLVESTGVLMALCGDWNLHHISFVCTYSNKAHPDYPRDRSWAWLWNHRPILRYLLWMYLVLNSEMVEPQALTNAVAVWQLCNLLCLISVPATLYHILHLIWWLATNTNHTGLLKLWTSKRTWKWYQLYGPSLCYMSQWGTIRWTA